MKNDVKAYDLIALAIAGLAASALPAAGQEATTETGIDLTPTQQVDVRPLRNDQMRFEFVGRVCEDLDQNGECEPDEPGVEDVMVSNGIDVVKTNVRGRYVLPLPSEEITAAGTAVFVTQPKGYRVPVDANQVPQFAYIYKPAGSPESKFGGPFRFGGLEATVEEGSDGNGVPLRIHFPLIKTDADETFKIAVSGDTQTYSNFELGLFRDTVIAELAARDDLEAYIIEGDIMGDDLALYERFKQVTSLAGVPQYYVPGNHDLDFDAASDEHSFDTFRREWGPEYYSFDIGDVHFVVLDDVFYPCLADQNPNGEHGGCDDDILSGATYNGVVTERQLEWLKNDLAHVPEDKLVVLNTHIPIHSFIDQNLARQMIDNVVELYEVLGCERAADGTFPPEDCTRPLLALSGHTHTNEQILPGEVFEGWNQELDLAIEAGRSPGPAPFPQIVVGAASGSWWSGDFNDQVLPESFQRLGAPRGYYLFDFDGNQFQDTFKATGRPITDQMSIDIYTPAFDEWFRILTDWRDANPAPGEAPPVNINSLPDTKLLTPADLPQAAFHINVWNGSNESTVTVSIDGGPAIEAVRTQAGEGENILESLDVAALKRQMMVARHAYVTDVEDARENGFELFRASNQCGEVGLACTPRPLSSFFRTDQSSHLWAAPLPTDLAVGPHVAVITTTDRFGRTYSETLAFEVREERPGRFFSIERDPIPGGTVDVPFDQEVPPREG